MNAKQREAYWLRVERLRRSLDKKYSSLFKGIIMDELRKLTDDLRKYGPQGTLSMMGAYTWDKSIMDAMTDMYREIAVKFGNASFRAVRMVTQKAADPFGLNDTWVREVLRFLGLYGLELAVDMTETTKSRMIDIIQRGMMMGWSVDRMADEMMTEGDRYSEIRARRIARTEVMRASNYATMKGAEEVGFEMDKMWIATRDSRTRRFPRQNFDHWDMDGKQVPMNAPFESADKFGRPLLANFPGDPQAPAGFTINCRCTIGFIPKRDQFGRLIPKK